MYRRSSIHQLLKPLPFLLLPLTFLLLPLTSSAQVTSNYPFRPSDGVMINTFPDTSSFLHRIYAIDDQGYIELPIVNKVKVSQMTREQLQQFIREKFKAYLRTPNVTVKPMVQVSMLGGFNQPGLYYVDINNSLWEVVRQAGGTVDEDGIYAMKWERDKDKVRDVVDYFEAGVSLRQMGFRSGDQFYTPVQGARTFWDTLRDVMPIVTLGITITTLYISYQRDILLLQTQQRR